MSMVDCTLAETVPVGLETRPIVSKPAFEDNIQAPNNAMARDNRKSVVASLFELSSTRITFLVPLVLLQEQIDEFWFLSRSLLFFAVSRAQSCERDYARKQGVEGVIPYFI